MLFWKLGSFLFYWAFIFHWMTSAWNCDEKTHTNTLSLTHTDRHTQTPTYTISETNTHTDTHTHTHTHTHTDKQTLGQIYISDMFLRAHKLFFIHCPCDILSKIPFSINELRTRLMRSDSFWMTSVFITIESLQKLI